MKKYIIIAMILTGCGKDCATYVNPVSSSTVTASEAEDISRIIQEENDYRFSIGQSPLSQGLTCNTYTGLSNSLTAFPTSLPSAAATFAYIGEFNQPNTSVSVGLNVLPTALRTQSAYLQWYALRCSGYIVVTSSGFQSFELTSDDAGLLYIDNVKVVDNDGNHGAITKTGSRNLKRGVHSIRIDYMQGPAGNQALIIKSNGVIIPANKLFR